MNQRLAHKMEYVNPVSERSTVSLISYTPEFKEQYKRIYNSCYHEMREALDIKPYDFIQNDSFSSREWRMYIFLSKTVS